MGLIRNLFSLHRQPPAIQLLVSFFVVVVPGTVVMILAAAAGTAIFGPAIPFTGILTDTVSESDISFVKYLLIVQDIALFIIPSVIVMILLAPPGSKSISLPKTPAFSSLILVVLAAFAVIPVTAFLGRLNSAINISDLFPQSGGWLNEQEESIDRILALVLGERGPGEILLSYIIVAALPAIGEEMLFRGVFQKILRDLFRSGPAAVWVSATLFSAVHLQFEGFLPRLFLGIVFGYLFLWSGNLWLPVTAHFVNNALAVTGYITSASHLSDIATEHSMLHDLLMALPSLAVVIAVLYVIKRFSGPELALNLRDP